MKKPLIGLTPSHDTDTDDLKMRPTYMAAVTASGGIPVILPFTAKEEDLKQLIHTLDGFLFTGGPDVHPFYFGEETHPACGNVSSQRDLLELSLLPLILEAKKPLLGICRGIQVINIGLGGTIFQDIKSQLKEDHPIAHQQPFAFKLPSHTVTLSADSKLAQISCTKTLHVNSMHHQAVKTIAPGLTVCGRSKDHLVEAVEMPDYPYLIAVQWHPEYLWEEQEPARRLFESFVNACNPA